MKKIQLIRLQTDNQGTHGILLLNNFSCVTLELPWRGNISNLSCIPKGKYEIVPVCSNKFKSTYWVKSVPNRSHVLFHSGNWAGNSELDYRTHSLGCILLGRKRGIYLNQRAIFISRITVKNFLREMNGESGILNIEERY